MLALSVLGSYLAGASTDSTALNHAFPILTILLWLVAALPIVLVGLTVLVWRERTWGIIGRLHYTLIMAAGLAFLWFEVSWNLLKL